jgi:hypothetical protein
LDRGPTIACVYQGTDPVKDLQASSLSQATLNASNAVGEGVFNERTWSRFAKCLLMTHAASNDKHESGLHPGDVFEGELSRLKSASRPQNWSEGTVAAFVEGKQFLSQFCQPPRFSRDYMRDGQ